MLSTDKLDLQLPSTDDVVDVNVLNANFQKIDDAKSIQFKVTIHPSDWNNNSRSYTVHSDKFINSNKYIYYVNCNDVDKEYFGDHAIKAHDITVNGELVITCDIIPDRDIQFYVHRTMPTEVEL